MKQRQTARKSMLPGPRGVSFAKNPFERKTVGRPKKKVSPPVLSMAFGNCYDQVGRTVMPYNISELPKDTVYHIDCNCLCWNAYREQPIVVVRNFKGQQTPKYWNLVLKTMFDASNERRVPGTKVNLATVKVVQFVSPCVASSELWMPHNSVRVANHAKAFKCTISTMAPHRHTSEMSGLLSEASKRPKRKRNPKNYMEGNDGKIL